MLPALVEQPVDSPARTVLKDEPDTFVERRAVPTADGGHDDVVVKTYRVRGLRWLQSWWRKCRAQREHDHLATIVRAGVPCLQPLGWSAERRFPFGFRSSTLRTRYLPNSVPLKQVLRTLPPRGAAGRTRQRLATAMFLLVIRLPRGATLCPNTTLRNSLARAEPAAATLAVCDTPACIATGRPLHGHRLARIDLFLGAFSPSRRRDWSRTERLRWLLGYCDGDRAAARPLWRRMVRRSTLQNELERALAMAVLTYILDWLRPHRRADFAR